MINLVAVSGCYAPHPVEGLPCADGRLCPDGLACNADNICVAHDVDAGGELDGEIVDAIGTPDRGATLIDAMPDAPGSTLVARYRFDGDLVDETGMHDGVASAPGLTFVADATGGQAVHIPVGGASWVRVADSADFDLAAGRIRLAFRVGSAAPAEDLGLVSRDANGTATNGHFSIRVGHDGIIVLRIQQLGTPTVQAFRCTAAPVTEGAWHDIDASFGPGGLTLDVDGGPATGTTWTDAGGALRDCTTPWTGGIDGNDNPWVFGGLTVTSMEGTGVPVTAVAQDVDLDDIRILR